MDENQPASQSARVLNSFLFFLFQTSFFLFFFFSPSCWALYSTLIASHYVSGRNICTSPDSVICALTCRTPTPSQHCGR